MYELPPEQRARGNPYLKGTVWNARFGVVPSLKRLEQLSNMQQMRQREYRDAWAWIHFLLHDSPEVKAELVAHLDDIARRSPPGRLSEQLTRRLGQPGKRFAAHFRTWNRQD